MNKNSIIWLVAISVLVIGGIIVFINAMNGRGSQEFAEASDGRLTIVQNNRNLGKISMKTGKVKIPYTIVNESDDAVVLGSASTSCMCTEGVVTTMSGETSPAITMHTSLNLAIRLEPGESATLTAVFDPNAHGPDATGAIVRHIYIDTNSTTNPKLDFVFQGNVVK